MAAMSNSSEIAGIEASGDGANGGFASAAAVEAAVAGGEESPDEGLPFAPAAAEGDEAEVCCFFGLPPPPSLCLPKAVVHAMMSKSLRTCETACSCVV